MADILVSKYGELPVVATYIDGKMQRLSLIHDSDRGNVYLCRVENIVKNISSAFVRYNGDNIGYIPLKNILPANVINRAIESGKDIRQGDELILQVETEPQKLKKAKLTSYISISGKYSVVTLGKKGLGVSMKLDDHTRKDLLNVFSDVYRQMASDQSKAFVGGDYGVILRTEVQELISPEVTEQSLMDKVRSDIEFNLKKLSDILNEGRTRTVGSCLLTKGNSLVETHISNARNFLLSKGIEDINMLETSVVYSIKNDIDKLGQNRVWLKSGAFLIIEQLESFNAIDVNTGKAITGKKDIIKKVNEEAALEIMRQVRLRNLTGMILIDFINMKDKNDVEELCCYVQQLCRKEDVHTRFVDITGLGIVELTRNKNDKSLKEILENQNNSVDNKLYE